MGIGFGIGLCTRAGIGFSLTIGIGFLKNGFSNVGFGGKIPLNFASSSWTSGLIFANS